MDTVGFVTTGCSFLGTRAQSARAVTTRPHGVSFARVTMMADDKSKNPLAGLGGTNPFSQFSGAKLLRRGKEQFCVSSILRLC